MCTHSLGNLCLLRILMSERISKFNNGIRSECGWYTFVHMPLRVLAWLVKLGNIGPQNIFHWNSDRIMIGLWGSVFWKPVVDWKILHNQLGSVKSFEVHRVFKDRYWDTSSLDMATLLQFRSDLTHINKEDDRMSSLQITGFFSDRSYIWI